jgi:translocation and assembly module TamA
VVRRARQSYVHTLLMLGLAVVLTASPQRAPAADGLFAPRGGFTLEVPNQLRELLETHFQPPTAPLRDDTAVAAFVRRAQREIPELLATEGYFSPTVEVRQTAADAFSVIVTPGPRTLVGEVSIDFFGDIAGNDPERRRRVERLRAAWPLDPGQPFRTAAWEDAKAGLLARVARRDYRRADIVDSVAEVDPATGLARLSLAVDSGPPFRFGELSISGLRRYDEGLIREQAPFRPGDPYRQDLLLEYQTKLQNMPQFSSVTVTLDPDTARPDAAPVRVLLAEAKSQQLGFGAGYSTNTGKRGEINYRNYNFFSRPWTFGSSLRLEEKRQVLAAGIDTAPNAKGRHLAWNTRVEATDIQGLKTLHRVLGVGRVQTLGRVERRIGLDFQREDRRPEGGVQEANSALVLDWRWTRRKVDSPLMPRRGDIIDLRIGGASRQVISDRDFLRSHLRYQRWWAIGRRDVLSLRGEAGLTAATSRLGIPQDYLFRAGGAQSVRGYAYNSLGVREGAAVVGGRAMVTGSAEYTHWFQGNWGGAVFFDIGNATDDRHNLQLASGYGIGARWKSPAGPLGLDVAYGERTGTWRIHFAISVGF